LSQLEHRSRQIDDLSSKLALARTLIKYKEQSKSPNKLNPLKDRDQDHLLELTQAKDRVHKLERELAACKTQASKDTDLLKRNFTRQLEQAQTESSSHLTMQEALVAQLKA
jgi:non-homologous end joining protein Ku